MYQAPPTSQPGARLAKPSRPSGNRC